MCEVCNERPLRYVSTRECSRCYNRRYCSQNREKVRAYKNAHQREARASLSDKTMQMPSFDLGKAIAYSTAHSRVLNWRGRASDKSCAHCGGRAREWAYRGGSVYEQQALVPGFAGAEAHTASYSPDPLDYDPLCRPCHVRHDRAAAKERNGSLHG